MPDLNEHAKIMGRKIRLYTSRDFHANHSKIDDNPDLWQKEEFIATLLLNTEEQKYYGIDKPRLVQIKDEFTNETKTEIDLNLLFKNNWLRIVTGIVYIPASIRGSLQNVKKLNELRNELLFLRKLKEDKSNKISLQEFNACIDKYQSENNVLLEVKNASEAHLLSIDEEKNTVNITNVDYYDPIIENWDNFQFLNFLKDMITGGQSNLIIKKDELERLHTDHTKNYSFTPPLSQMLDSGLAKEVLDEYVISLFEERYCSYMTLDKAGAILWVKLNDTLKGIPISKIMITWCRKMVIPSGHNSDVFKYLTKAELDIFNQAAVEVINQQTDLYTHPSEYKRALLDYYMDRDLMTLRLAEKVKAVEFSKSAVDAFDMMRAISKIQRINTDDYLYFSQSTLETIAYLLGQIVKSYTCEDYNYGRLNELIKDIYQKPFLLWTLCFWIWEWKPELIPILMKNTSLTSVLFSLVKKITITPHIFDAPSEIKSKLSISLFKHVIDIVQLDSQIPRVTKAKIILDCLWTSTIAEFQIKGQIPQHQREVKDDAIKLSNELRQEFMDRPKEYQTYRGQPFTQEKYYTELLKDIFVFVTALTPEDKYNNGSIDFHYEKISLLLFISALSQNISNINHNQQIPSFDIAKALIDCYSKTISATSATSLEVDSLTPKEVVPIFLPATANIQHVDWGTLFLLLESENLSTKFLNPCGLGFNDEGDEFDSFNRFIISKLRTHLRVLITTYNQLKVNENRLRQSGILIDSTLVRLQNAMLDIVEPYSLNEPTKRRFDIFNTIDERSTFRSSEDELIPFLVEVSNNFVSTAREKIINSLLRTDKLVRTVKLIEKMSSEQDQSALLNLLSSYNLQEELKRLSSVTDFQYLLSTLSIYSQFQGITLEILSYWEEHIVPRKRDLLSSEIKVTTYRTKLLQAYQANNLEAIIDVDEPDGDIYLHSTKIYPINEKDFYRALYFLKNNNPKQAYSLFQDLLYRKDGDSTVIALNRFASKIHWAEKEDDFIFRNKLFSEALSEWDTYRRQLSKDASLDHVAENILHNRLIAFDALEKYDEFDNAYAGLAYIERVRSGFFELGIQNRLKRNMTSEALALVEEASKFHRLKDGSVPQFVKDMNDLIVNKHDPEISRNLFASLLGAQPDNLVKLIPDSVNSGKDVNSYILAFTIKTASNMLSNINSIAEVHYEDKYTDQMIFGLNAMMNFHHWKASTSRGGFSNSKLNNHGEIDFAVYSASNEELAVFEALNLYGENNTEVKKHSTKIFNYTPSKQGLFLLAYYKGKEQNFISTWGKYKNSILSLVEFPESYSLLENSFNDLSEQYSNAAIRVGSTVHGENITLYHVFININYKAEMK